MEFNYIVVLFKNRTKQKILKKFITLERVNQYFKKLEKKSNEVVFEKQYGAGYCQKSNCLYANKKKQSKRKQKSD